MRAERVLVVLAFLLTRVALVAMADGLTPYPQGWVDGDIYLYEDDGETLLAGAVPYRDVELEYPPGSLPSIVLPAVLPAPYREAFVALSLGVDALAFLGLLALRRRWGHPLGAWVWVLGVPLLGPIVYLRFDLVPALATIWALERIAAGGYLGGGAWLGFGAVAKIYPGMLALPVLAATRRWRVLAGLVGAGVVALGVLLAIGGFGVLGPMLGNVLGYHGARGIQVESSWSTLLLAAWRLGLAEDIATNYSFYAHHLEGPATAPVKSIALAFAVGGLALGTWLAARAGRRLDPARAAALGAFTTLALLLALGTVYSTQYTLWLVALAAVVACAPPARLRVPVLLVLPIALLSHLGYPFYYGGLLLGHWPSILVVGGRNLLVVLVAVWSSVVLARLPAATAGPLAVRERELVS